jgi:hypothetical protein
MDEECCMSGIDVRIVKRDHPSNPNRIAARCFFERDIVGIMGCGESMQSPRGWWPSYREACTLTVRKWILCGGDRDGSTEQT